MATPVPGTDRLILFFAKTVMFSPEKYHLDTVQSLRCLIYWPNLLGNLVLVDHSRRKIRRHLTANDTTLKRQRLLSYLLLEKGVFYIRQIVLAEMFTFAIEEHIFDTDAGKTTVLICHICLISTGIEKNEQHLNID
jgi:hypothetical protein